MQRLFLFVLITAYSLSGYSQDNEKQFAFRSLTVEEGLSQNSVVSVSQDSTGYMWFATQDGLNKYDGRQFVVYNKQFEDVTRPTFSRLGKVVTDRSSNVWIVSNSGILERFDTEVDSFQSIPFKHPVSTIYESTQSKHFIGTYGFGLYQVAQNS